jgi:hypothetical protein
MKKFLAGLKNKPNLCLSTKNRSFNDIELFVLYYAIHEIKAKMMNICKIKSGGDVTLKECNK